MHLSPDTSIQLIIVEVTETVAMSNVQLLEVSLFTMELMAVFSMANSSLRP